MSKFGDILKNHCLKSHKEDDTKGLKKLANKKLKVLSKNKKKLKKIFKGCEISKKYIIKK